MTGMTFPNPSPTSARPTSIDSAARRQRLAAVRRVMRSRDRRLRSIPSTRAALGQAMAVEARAMAEPWSTVVAHTPSHPRRRAQ